VELFSWPDQNAAVKLHAAYRRYLRNGCWPVSFWAARDTIKANLVVEAASKVFVLNSIVEALSSLSPDAEAVALASIEIMNTANGENLSGTKVCRNVVP
jgi:hypothetical protein